MILWNEIKTLIYQIPSNFWGIIVGSFFTLLAVHLTNRANDRRLRLQFENDRKAKSDEHALTLRKEIYLSATEAIYAGIESLSKFGNLNISNDQITNIYNEKSPVLAKVHVIGQKETIESLILFTNELENAHIRLFTKRLPLLAEVEKLIVLKNQIDSFGIERTRMLDLMKQFNINRENDNYKFKILEDNFNFEQKRINDSLQEQEKIRSELKDKTIELIMDGIKERTNLSSKIIPILIAVRNELGLPIDESDYISLLDKNKSNNEALIAELVETVQRL